MKPGIPPFPFAQSWCSAADRATWKLQQKAWRAERKAAWKAARDQARAQARAERWHNPLASVLSVLWALFWIGFAYWMITGGPEARMIVWNAVHSLGSTVRDFFVNLVGAVQ